MISLELRNGVALQLRFPDRIHHALPFFSCCRKISAEARAREASEAADALRGELASAMDRAVTAEDKVSLLESP